MKVQNILSSFKQRISKLEEKNFIVVAAALCISIFGLGVWLGASSFDSETNNKNVNSAERLKIAIPAIGGIVGTSFFVFFVNQYVRVNIEKHKRNFKAEKISSPENVLNSLRENQDLDFLSHLYPEKRREIKFKGFGISMKKLKSESSDKELEEKINFYKQEDKYRKEALNGLVKGLTEESDGSTPFLRLIVEVCNGAVGISKNEAPKALEPFYDNMHEYLKAWLLCSIKYGVPIPVTFEIQSSSVVIRESSSGREISTNLNIDKYKEAIQSIQKLIDDSQLMKEIFPTSGSRSLVKKYLDDLILILEEKISSPMTENIPEESGGRSG